MAYEQKRLDRPLSRLELAVAVILISIFVAYFLEKIVVLTVVAEARYLELTINQMRSELMIYSAGILIEEKYEDMYKITGTNPLGVAMAYPRNYIDDYNSSGTNEIKPGQWYYDTENRQLVYHVVNDDYFNNTTTGLPSIRMALTLNYDDRDHDGAYTSGIDQPWSITLTILDQYEWTY